MDSYTTGTLAGAGSFRCRECGFHVALRVLELVGRTDVPVAAGAERPLVRELVVAAHVHGETGLEGAELPHPDVPLATEHAVDLIARLLREAAHPITLVPTGPLTNLALLLRTYPELGERVREIVLMGGSAGVGNVEPLAEFNIHVDPEAADVVFSSGLPVTMCGLNVTHQALATEEVLERLRALGTPLADTVVLLLGFFRDRYRDLWGLPAPPVHDPVAVARVIDPELVRCEEAHVAVELHGTHTRGATVCDRFGVRGRIPNALVAMELDAAGFWELIVAAVDQLGSAE